MFTLPIDVFKAVINNTKHTVKRVAFRHLFFVYYIKLEEKQTTACTNGCVNKSEKTVKPYIHQII